MPKSADSREVFVTVDKVRYLEERPFPPATPHVFRLYSDHPQSSAGTGEAAGKELAASHSNGEHETIEGEGVLREKPDIPPGSSFTYESFHLVKNRGLARCHYFLLLPDGKK